MKRCNMCKKFRKDKDVYYEPSRRTLMFGMSYGHVFYEHRCKWCERKLVKELNQLIKKIAA